ncbi:MAG: T9SS type A sorting domain-containing protein, partial [Chitinophagaceae bacterium]|nr:T9SS type A sorting domain-containing protein [Chitinophagaceae bacterium]
TLMPLPNHNSVYSGSARGYWFVAPTNFTITGLRVPSQAGTGLQYIQLVKLGVMLPISAGSQTSNFTTLVYINGATNGVIQSVNIPISAGDIIGILGTAGTSNSYATGAYTTNVYGNNFTIQRFGYQGHITGGATSQVWGVAQGAGGSISRVELYYGQPCAGVTNMAVNNISSMAADFSWTGVTGSGGYDYAVDQTAAAAPTGTVVNTNTTNGNISGLTPATTYYLHVRNYCSSTDKSSWDTVSFETLPPCSEATGVTITNVDSNSASFTWNSLVTGLIYRYVIDTNRSDPAYNAGTPTNVAAGSVVNLLEGTKYYIHIKAYCVANDSSGWSLDSFYTPVVCRAPLVSFTDINSNRAIVYWSPRLSAIEYEYLVNTESAPPVVGTKTIQTSVQIPYLDANQKYYFHVRSHCSDRGILASSQWVSYEFSTHAVSVGELDEDNMVMIYPNPANDNFTFTVSKVEENGVLTVTDISGREVVKTPIDKKQTSVSLKGQQTGIYLLKYTTALGTGTYRILKQ